MRALQTRRTGTTSPSGTQQEPVRLLFLSPHDPADVHAWSGTPHHMLAGFNSLPGVECIADGALVDWFKPFTYSKRLLWGALGFDYVRNHSLATQTAFAAQVRARIARHRPDALIGTHPMAFSLARASIPSAFWADAAFASLVGYYPHLKRPPPAYVHVANWLEQRALDHVSWALFSSSWAAEEAMAKYRARDGAIGVVPYGANVEADPKPAAMARRAGIARAGTIRLLFVGTEWVRKGGDVALDIVRTLRSQGRDARLDIVGCDPPGDVPTGVTCHGFLSKHRPDHQTRLRELYREATLLVLPTRNEAAAVVLAESAAFALPTVTTRVGGNATIVRDGVTGLLLPATASAAEFAAAIVDLVDDPDRYLAMCDAAHDHFTTQLNWTSACRRVVELLESRRAPAGATTRAAEPVGAAP
jgi:glycosyltransferase involved in cell wall biosynthesis